MKLVLYPEVESPRIDKVRAAAGPMQVVNAQDEAAAVREIADADGFFGKLTPPMLAAATRLRWVQTATAGLEHYVFPELVRHPCALTNMRGLFSDVIADHVMGLTIALARHFPTYFRQQQQGFWGAVGGEEERTESTRGTYRVTAIDRAHLHLGDCTMGIVGLGHIGSEIARRAQAFSMRVLAVDPRQTGAPENVTLWTPERLPQLLAESDFVVIAAPQTPDTQKLFRRAQFQQMKRTAYLINIGRGAIVDLADLTAALEAGEIAGAGLDVLETEPLPVEHKLWRLPNAIITPHVAAMSPHLAQRHLAVLLDNVGRFSRGEPLRNMVDKAQWF